MNRYLLINLCVQKLLNEKKNKKKNKQKKLLNVFQGPGILLGAGGTVVDKNL